MNLRNLGYKGGSGNSEDQCTATGGGLSTDSTGGLLYSDKVHTDMIVGLCLGN